MKPDLNNAILSRLEQVELLLRKQTLLQKTIYIIDEAAEYLSLSTSHLYKLTAGKLIEHFRQGKKVYFRRESLDKWMLAKRVKTKQEVQSEVATDFYLKNKK
ncbi:MAG: helix-turn-helix domain-containing protein [Bacteroidota bacterium]|nr:helix-turn-helix domain-containing protein [Bacteroidota bacterium]